MVKSNQTIDNTFNSKIESYFLKIKKNLLFIGQSHSFDTFVRLAKTLSKS